MIEDNREYEDYDIEDHDLFDANDKDLIDKKFQGDKDGQIGVDGISAYGDDDSDEDDDNDREEIIEDENLAIADLKSVT